MIRPSEMRLRDPLSEVTRKERRALLGISALGIVIVKSGLVPAKVTALGIEFTRTDQRALLLALGAVVTYFVAAFLIYAVTDLVAWRVAYHNAAMDWRRERDRLSREEQEAEERIREYFARARWWHAFSRPISVLRATFEFAVLVSIGIYAATLLFGASPPPQTPQP